MTIRARLTIWFAVVMLVSLVAMGSWCYYEFVIEPRNERLHPAPDLPKDQQDENDVSDLVGILFWCGIPALALALGGGWFVMRKALAPVVRLTVAAEQMNEHNLAQTLPLTGSGDELDRLTQVFNGMTERLNTAFGRIREFTLHASHELKTPLTVMHGEVETWLNENQLSPEQRERLANTLDEIQRLAKIVDGLTLLTKADAGQIQLASEPVKLDELVRDAAADAQSLARSTGIDVQLGRCDEVVVQGDRHRLRQLLLNLCDNAVKYNAAGGKVSIDLTRSADHAELRISNTGPGVTPEKLPHVFEPFFRGDPSHSQTIEGCGLGLSIAHWIVTAHKGLIKLESDPDKMTVATVVLLLSA